MQSVINQQPDSDVTVTITSCGRLDLLDRTVNGLFLTAGQALKIIIFDDSTDPFEKLKELYGTRFDLYKPDKPVGQAKALDFLYSKVETPWLFHCEDDWEFIEPGYLQRSMQILMAYPMVAVVGLSWNGDLDKYGAKGETMSVPDSFSPNFGNSFFIHKRWRISEKHDWWNGWISSPNLKRTSDVRKLPPFSTVNEESDYDRDVFGATGLTSVWLPKQYVKHIGDGRSLYPQGDKIKRSWLVPYSGTSIYSKEFHKDIEESERGQAEALGEILIRRFKPASVCDAGCGTGLYLLPFKRAGIMVHGLDASEAANENALPEVSGKIYHHDLGQDIACSNGVEVGSCRPLDLCLCLETLEHIPSEKSHQAIANLVHIVGGKGRIIFSAAVPGQGGTGHVNCKSKDYWRTMFSSFGYVEDHYDTQYILDEISVKPHMGWLTNNLMVMRPVSSKPSKPVFRFHLLGLAHLPTNEAMQSCAYTQKVWKLAKMLKKLGHTVFFYGGEGSEVECDRSYTVVTDSERKACYGDYNWGKEFFKHDPTDAVHKAFAARCIAEINAHKRKDDFLLCPMGTYDQPIADAVKLRFTVESGIGYSGVFAPFKVWESYGWMNHIYGMMKVENGAWYDTVIPNYWNPDDFHMGEKKGYHLFVGRLISRKGLSVAAEATEKLGVKLIVAGQGDLSKVDGYDLTKYKHIEHIGTVGKKERADLMAGATVTWVPTWYMAPFEGVHIESMFCGTPVLTTDWGCFPETNLHGVTGFRCRTMNEFLWGARKSSELDPDKIRQYAIDRFSMDRATQMYQSYFERLWDLRENGWYQNRKDPGWA